MTTTTTIIDSATADITDDFDDFAGISYRDELTAEFIADTLARSVEGHLRLSMQAAIDDTLFAAYGTENDVELTDGIVYRITGRGAEVSLRDLYINVDGIARYDVHVDTITVELFEGSEDR